LADDAYGSIFSSVSLSGLLAFLLSFTEPPDPAAGAFGANSAETDDSKTAIVWVKVPGFIGQGAAVQRAGLKFVY
jgi:hypothetical protein